MTSFVVTVSSEASLARAARLINPGIKNEA